MIWVGLLIVGALLIDWVRLRLRKEEVRAEEPRTAELDGPAAIVRRLVQVRDPIVYVPPVPEPTMEAAPVNEAAHESAERRVFVQREGQSLVEFLRFAEQMSPDGFESVELIKKPLPRPN